MLAEPGPVLVDVGGVHDQQVTVALAADDGIVHHSAGRAGELGVEALADGKVEDVAGHHPGQEAGCAFSAHNELAHVRDVEEADGLADRLVLLDDARVLHRHVPAAERHHAGLQGEVLRM
ncbi:hypothetical protein D3C72_1851890 [compost metagenome]